MNKYQEALDRITYHIKPMILNSDPKVELIGLMDLEALQELVDEKNKGEYVTCNACGDIIYIQYGKTYSVGCPNCGVEEPDWSEIE